jgi:predicted CopG family antitoxin
MTSTTIQISSNLQQELNKMKLFSRETYEEVIWNIIEDTKELSEQTRKDIALSRKEISEGKFITLSDLKKKYNLQ